MSSEIHFKISGSLQGSISGRGDQQQGPDLVTDIPLTGEIDLPLTYNFSLNTSAPSHAVSLDAVALKDLLKNLSHDISSFDSFDITAAFDPVVHTLTFELHPELSVQYKPFFGWYKPADQAQNGFGFLGFDIVHQGDTYTIKEVGAEQTIVLKDNGHITFSALRSTYNCGQLGYMGGFKITL